jgi:hypothetical protein
VLGVATDPVACRVTAIDVADDEPGAGPGG